MKKKEGILVERISNCLLVVVTSLSFVLQFCPNIAPAAHQCQTAKQFGNFFLNVDTRVVMESVNLLILFFSSKDWITTEFWER